MNRKATISPAVLFASFADGNADLWQGTVEQVVTHATLGSGRITAVYEKGRWLRIAVRFDGLPADAATKLFDPAAFQSDKFSNLTLPADLEKQLQAHLEESRVAERTEKQRLARQQRQERHRQKLLAADGQTAEETPTAQ